MRAALCEFANKDIVHRRADPRGEIDLLHVAAPIRTALLCSYFAKGG